MTYKEILNKGLVKEASPRWVKEVLRLVNSGQREAANKILSRNAVVVPPYSGFKALLGFSPSGEVFGKIPIRTLANLRNLAAIDRFVNPKNKPFKRWFRKLFLQKKLLHNSDVPFTGRGTPNEQAYLDRLKRYASKVGLTFNGEELAFFPSQKLRKHLAQPTKYEAYINMLQRSKLFRYGNQFYNLMTAHYGHSLTNNLKNPLLPIAVDKAKSVSINNPLDYVWGGKDLYNLRQNFLGRQDPVYFSGLVEAAKRYRDNVSQGMGSGDALVAIPKNKLKNLLFTPHLAIENEMKRKNWSKSWLGRLFGPRIHNPGLSINHDPLYQTILRYADNPGALQYALKVTQTAPGQYVGNPIQFMQRKYPLSKLQRAIHRGDLLLNDKDFWR